MELSERLVDSLEVDVVPGRVYEFRIVSYHNGEEVHKGMVFYVNQRDAKGKVMNKRLLNFSSSRSFSNYIYITTGSEHSPTGKEVGIQISEKVATLELGLVNWGFLNNPSGRIERLEHPSIRIVDLSESELGITKGINDIWTYHISIQVANPRASIGRLAVLTVNYYDSQNAELVPKRVEYLTWSTKLSAFYRYITSQDGAVSMSFEHILHPPEGTTLCKCTLMEWSESGVEIAVSGPKEYSLDWSNSNKKKLLQEASILDSDEPALLTKQADVADSVSLSSHHELRYKSYIQSGDLSSAQNESQAEHNRNPSSKSLHRLTHVNELIQSLDVDWFPTLHSSNKLSGEICDNSILHLFKVSYPFESTGGAIRNMNIVLSQLRNGLKPFVVTPLNYPRIFNENNFQLDENIKGVRYIRLDIGSSEMKSLTYICKNLQLNTQMLAGIVRNMRPSIIHAASGYRGYELAIMAKALSDHFSIPWIYEVRSFHEHTWTNDLFQAKTSSHSNQRMMRENSLMELSNHIVTISESMKNAIVDRGIDVEKVTVIHNAVDLSVFSPRKKKIKLAKQYGLHKKTVIGYISNISLREGHDILIKSLPMILETNPDVVLLLVGDGRQKSSLEKLTTELGLNEKVVFTGNVDHSVVIDYYALMDLFIVPRRRDYAADLVTPMKPFEAMAMKIPVLVSDRPALLEIIGSDRGFSFKTGDSNDLAKVVNQCLSDSKSCRICTEKAYEWLIENRTWEKNAEAYSQLYSQLLESA